VTSDELARTYRATLLRYLARREESSRTAGYELGREALVAGVGLLELVTVHHRVMAEVLQETLPADVPDLAVAAADLLVEVLASYDMVQRGLPRETLPGEALAGEV
jgi:hypothetical protein